MVAQWRYANINTILAYVDNQQLFDSHAGQRLLQPTVVPEDGGAPEQEDGERWMRPTRGLESSGIGSEAASPLHQSPDA